ncbi:MAG: alkaline phosphatase [Tannerellaceae bacterium]|nr:alkaline phosphatase [Tannerellaceae bacterium]
MKSGILLLLFTVIASLSVDAQKKVNNVIFMIGDGMGINQVYASLTANGSLTMTAFPYTGFVRTCSANRYITDSAAAGTALSSGRKTDNGVIGMSPESVKYVSIMEEAKENGLGTGIVVTCTVTHATPAAYYAHQPDREMHEEIALDFTVSGIDVCIGGGKQYFMKRKDGKDLISDMESKQYQVVFNQQELDCIHSGKVMALLANEDLPKVSEGRGDMLPEGTAKAIGILAEDYKEKGFFLMVEGSQIDWGGHANDQQYIISEVVDFDKAVKKALDFAEKDGNTLVIVTADHETGGAAIIDGDINRKEVKLAYTTKGHSASLAPVFAYGPGAEEFSGYFDNTEFKAKIEKLAGF